MNYRGHTLERSTDTAVSQCIRMGDARYVHREIIVCEGPHGWTAREEQPTTWDDAKRTLRYRISEGITRSHQGSRLLEGKA